MTGAASEQQTGQSKHFFDHLRSVQVKAEDDSEWVAEGQQTGCVVLTEGDPPPGAHFGHMSFSSFNPELQKLQVGNKLLLLRISCIMLLLTSCSQMVTIAKWGTMCHRHMRH